MGNRLGNFQGLIRCSQFTFEPTGQVGLLSALQRPRNHVGRGYGPGNHHAICVMGISQHGRGYTVSGEVPGLGNAKHICLSLPVLP